MPIIIALTIAALIVLLPMTPPAPPTPALSPVIPTLPAPPRRAPTTAIGDPWTAIAPTSAPTTAQPTPLATPKPRRLDAALWRRWLRIQEETR